METYIYIIDDGENNVKIGKSNNPFKRVKTLQTGNPKSLEIVATFSVSKEKVFTVEKKCHHKLICFTLGSRANCRIYSGRLYSKPA
jgi:hypothetical protein